MDVLPRVQKAAGGDGDVGHFVAVERKWKIQINGGRSAVAFGQHGVLLHDPVLGRVQPV